ncbi:MAG: hypothetical protein V4649_12055 [Bacteroidota bacterium]
MKQCLIVILLLAASTAGFAQKSTTWDKWKWLIGDWKTEGEPTPSQGFSTFSFKPDLDQMILVRKSHTEFEQLRSKAATYDDLLIVYPGYSGTQPKAVYFDSQGHAIDYTFNVSDKAITFNSNKVGNQPAFRLTYTRVDSNVINAKYEMSQDGQTYQTYMEGKSRRAK